MITSRMRDGNISDGLPADADAAAALDELLLPPASTANWKQYIAVEVEDCSGRKHLQRARLLT